MLQVKCLCLIFKSQIKHLPGILYLTFKVYLCLIIYVSKCLGFKSSVYSRVKCLYFKCLSVFVPHKVFIAHIRG